MKKSEIHPTAVISSTATIGDGCDIGPFVVIEGEAVIGSNNQIASHSVIKGNVRMGDNNIVHEHVVLGGTPQSIGFDVSINSYLNIADNNTFHEGVVLHRASSEGNATTVGSHCFFMNYTHLAHDCQVGDYVVMAPNAAIGGHVLIDDRAFISGGVMVHQFARIGRNAMVGGNAKITMDVLPFFITDGTPAKVRGLNVVGLKRNGLSIADIRDLKRAYQTLFDNKFSLSDRITEIKKSESPYVQHLIGFVEGAGKRGFHRAASTE